MSTVSEREGVEITTSEVGLRSQLRRIVEATSFLAVWMIVGFVLKPDANVYLLLGVPITVAFQLLVRKKPLRALWVRDAPNLDLARLGVPAKLVVIVFSAANSLLLYDYYVATHNWILILYGLVAISGTIPLAYAIDNFTRRLVRPLLVCFATAGTVSVGVFIFSYWFRAFAQHAALAVTLKGFFYVWLVSMFLNLPVVFLLEEVWFRGAFDSHIYHLGERRANLTAVYVSLLWGAWHFPILYTPSVGLARGIETLMSLLVFQGVVGYFLSIYWRKGGNLLIPGSVHAFADSVRNGLGPF